MTSNVVCETTTQNPSGVAWLQNTLREYHCSSVLPPWAHVLCYLIHLIYLLLVPLSKQNGELRLKATDKYLWCRNKFHTLMEKELPQEQPWSACGFLSTWKVERMSSWLKSRVDPFTNSRLSSSTTTPTPFCSKSLRECRDTDAEAKSTLYLVTGLLNNQSLTIIHSKDLWPVARPLQFQILNIKGIFSWLHLHLQSHQ